MATRTTLAVILSGILQNVDLTADELVIDSVRYGGGSGTLLTKTILDGLIANSHAAMSDNQNVVAGDGLTGGGSGATVTLDVGAGSGISVTANAVAVDSTVVRTNGANAFTADQSMGGFKLTNLATPTAAGDAASKAYVDGIASGLDVKASVRAATTAALAAVTYANGSSGVGATLTADANGALAAQDGVTLVANDRLLVKNQAAGLQNGVYIVTQVGDGSNPFILTRATDADQNAEVTANMFTFVEEGTVNSDSGWTLTTDNPITIGTTALSFTQFSGAGTIVAGAGLTKTGNTLDVVAADDSLTVNADSVQVKRDAAGAIGLSASGIKTNVDDSTVEISSNALRVKDSGISTAKIANAAVDETKLATSVAGAGLAGGAGTALSVNVDDSTIEINSDTLRIKDSGVSTAKIANNAVDENKLNASVAGAGLTGGGGSALAVGAGTGIQVNANDIAVLHAPALKMSKLAGESMAADTSFLVRMALNGETAGRVYKATNAAAIADKKFYAFGIASIGTAASAGDPVTVTSMGSLTLGSSDAAFNAADIGLPVYLTTAGGFSITPPSTAGTAVWRIGTVESTSSIMVGGQQLNGVN